MEYNAWGIESTQAAKNVIEFKPKTREEKIILEENWNENVIWKLGGSTIGGDGCIAENEIAMRCLRMYFPSLSLVFRYRQTINPGSRFTLQNGMCLRSHGINGGRIDGKNSTDSNAYRAFACFTSVCTELCSGRRSIILVLHSKTGETAFPRLHCAQYQSMCSTVGPGVRLVTRSVTANPLKLGI